MAICPILSHKSDDNHNYELNCKFNDNGDIVCTADQGLSKYVDEIAVVTINGFTSSGPIRHGGRGEPFTISEPVGYCYGVYSQDGSWYYQGETCQKSPANMGDEINYPEGNETRYTFDDPICSTYGPAYYNGFCAVPN